MSNLSEYEQWMRELTEPRGVRISPWVLPGFALVAVLVALAVLR